jgi:hypothetical protein
MDYAAFHHEEDFPFALKPEDPVLQPHQSAG